MTQAGAATRVYPDPSSRSKELFERAQASMPGGNTRTTVYTRPYPIYAAYGSGCRIWDVDGVSRIDCVNNFTALIHGHAHPEIVKIAQEQVSLGCSFGMPTESELELAELIVSRVATVERVRFMNSGTEAVMAAIKAARAFTGRAKIAKCEGAYHGTYDYAEISLDSDLKHWGDRWPRAIPYAAGTPSGVTDDVVVIPFNRTDEAADILRANGRELAAILVDPMPNRCGLIPGEAAYLQMLREVADDVGALLVFDEVITYRLDVGGAQSIWNVEPDLTTFGKIIGGGFPIGALGGREDVMDVFNPTKGKPAVPLGGTFSANPMSMRCGQAAVKMLSEQEVRRLNTLGDRLRAAINTAFKEAGIAGQATGMGSLMRIHLTDHALSDYRSVKRASSMARMKDLMVALLNNGVVISESGLVSLSTPMTSAETDFILAALCESLANCADLWR